MEKACKADRRRVRKRTVDPIDVHRTKSARHQLEDGLSSAYTPRESYLRGLLKMSESRDHGRVQEVWPICASARVRCPPKMLTTTTTTLYRRALHCTARAFSSTIVAQARRAVIYSSNGNPADTLRVLTVPGDLDSPPPPSTLNIRFLLSPINPSDINVIEGVYPAKPVPRRRRDLLQASSNDADRVFIAGNEGLAEVTEVGDGVQGMAKGDWVVMVKQQAGTWCSDANVDERDVVRIPKADGRLPSEVDAAVMTVHIFIYNSTKT